MANILYFCEKKLKKIRQKENKKCIVVQKPAKDRVGFRDKKKKLLKN
jgi:hypothetical protein